MHIVIIAVALTVFVDVVVGVNILFHLGPIPTWQIWLGCLTLGVPVQTWAVRRARERE